MPPNWRRDLIAVGDLLTSKNSIRDAEQQYDRAVKILEKSSGSRDAGSAPALDGMAAAMSNCTRRRCGDGLAARAIDSRERVRAVDDRSRGDAGPPREILFRAEEVSGSRLLL